MNSLDDELRDEIIAHLRQYATDAKYGDEYTAAHKIADRILSAVQARIPEQPVYPETMVYVEMVKKASENGKYDDMYENGWNQCVATIREAFGLAFDKPDVRTEVNNGKGESVA